MTTTGVTVTFVPIRAKSNGRYLCDYDPERQLLRFRRGEWEEIIDLLELAPAPRLLAALTRLAQPHDHDDGRPDPAT